MNSSGMDAKLNSVSSSSTISLPAVQYNGSLKRIRTARACDRCKRRKIRCTGTQPCEFCSRELVSCLYTTPHRRRRESHVTESDRLSLTRRQETSTILDPPDRRQEWNRHTEATANTGLVSISTNTISGQVSSPEAITDPQGQYLGPASGVSFLVRVRERLYQNHQNSASFTLGDAPLPDYEPTPSVMITIEDASRLVQKFFDFTVPIDRLLQRATIDQWLEEFHDTMGSMRDPATAPTRRAILWMIFAMAQEHMPIENNKDTSDKSAHYFLAAEYHLAREEDVVGIVSVQARLYQCFWLLSRSRINHCWALFGSAARMALALGLHRKRSARGNHGYSLIDLDHCRRTFWSAYHLDIHLSLTLGRPRIFHDEDIDQLLPSGAEDEDLMTIPPPPLNDRNNSVMLAPLSYYRLHLILSLVLRDLYCLRTLSIGEQCDFSEKHFQSLQQWRQAVPSFLQITSIESSPLIAIYQRQREVLNFTYWHAILVTCRPLILKNFSRLEQPYHIYNPITSDFKPRIDEIVHNCLQAALCIVNQVDLMFESGRMFRSFWGTCYYGFCAAAVLYVYTIQQASSTPETYQAYLFGATRCHNHLSTLTENGSLVARYCLMLEELRLEAQRKIENGASPLVEGPEGVARMNALAAEYANIIGAPVPFPDLNGDDFGTAPADIMTWMQFEQLDGDHRFYM